MMEAHVIFALDRLTVLELLDHGVRDCTADLALEDPVSQLGAHLGVARFVPHSSLVDRGWNVTQGNNYKTSGQ